MIGTKHLIAAVVGCGVFGLAGLAEAGRNKKVFDKVAEAAKNDRGPPASASEIPALAKLLEKAGWTPTPEMTGAFKAGQIWRPTDMGHSRVLSDCFDVTPTEDTYTSTEVVTQLQGGVSMRFFVGDAKVSAGLVKKVKFGTPTHVILDEADLVPSEECRTKLVRVASQGIQMSELYVVQQVLMAEIAEQTCGRIDAEGGFLMLGEADAAYARACSLFSLEPVAVAYRTVPMSRIMTGPSGSLPKPPTDVHSPIAVVKPSLVETDVQSASNRIAFTMVSAGRWHTCGLTLTGTVRCWGSERFGRTRPPSGTFEKISTGNLHTCGLTAAGEIKCRGNNFFDLPDTPTAVFDSQDAGQNHSCGVTTSGEVKCWGDDRFGQSTPPAGGFKMVSAGESHSCGVTTSGEVKCWGSDEDGQSTPPAGVFRSVSAGWSHTCGVTTSHEVKCWGYDHAGQSTPPAGGFKMVSAGGDHSCGLTQSGFVECWGRKDDGRTQPPPETFTALSAGWAHTCGLTKLGAVKCWGDDTVGQSSPP